MFKITIETMLSSNEAQSTIKVLEAVKCETLKEARKAVRILKKKYELISHAGHVVNYSNQIELSTNF